MNAFDMARSLVPKLNATDRRKLSMLLGRFPGAEIAHSGPAARSDGLENDWLYQGFQKELTRRGQPAFTGGIARVRSMAPNYELAAQETRDFFEAEISRPTPTELAALGVILGRSLAAYLEPWRTVALRTMLLNVGSTTEALECAFPGYMGCGMLPILIGRKI